MTSFIILLKFYNCLVCGQSFNKIFTMELVKLVLFEQCFYVIFFSEYFLPKYRFRFRDLFSYCNFLRSVSGSLGQLFL